MKNKLEHFLLSLLLGTSILLFLSFWLNINYGFNIFNDQHWTELANLQASQEHIKSGFYLSFIIAIIIFIIGLYKINIKALKNIKKEKQTQEIVKPTPITQTNTISEQKQDMQKTLSISNTPSITPTRPPRLNLPTNIEDIAQQHYTNMQNKNQQTSAAGNNANNQDSPYNSILSDIFIDKGYVVKPNPRISGFIPNLFAIGYDEVVWIGGVDCGIEQINNAVQKLNHVFTETLEDIKITIKPFILDTNETISETPEIKVFHLTQEIQDFVPDNKNEDSDDLDKDNFTAYSEYIDTIIQYIKNI